VRVRAVRPGFVNADGDGAVSVGAFAGWRVDLEGFRGGGGEEGLANLTYLTSTEADLPERVLCYMKMADETIARMVKCLRIKETAPVS
jgi:hypothetical protein